VLAVRRWHGGFPRCGRPAEGPDVRRSLAVAARGSSWREGAPAMTTWEQARERQRAHDEARTKHHLQRPKRTRRPAAQLRDVAQSAQERLAQAPTGEILAWAAEEFGYSTAVACSMADAVLPAV